MMSDDRGIDLAAVVGLPPAEQRARLLPFLQKLFPRLGIVAMRVNESAVSLNSVNGVLETDQGEGLFFKFHAEDGETESVSEYYRAGVLQRAGLRVLEPLAQSSVPGQQVLVYPRVDWPTAYDVWRTVDQGNVRILPTLNRAESNLNAECVAMAKATLHPADPTVMRDEGLWQLFTHRLHGEGCRLQEYYLGATVTLPRGERLTWAELAAKRWVVNGVEYTETLTEIITRAQEIITPAYLAPYGAITAHGDEHNGNKFLTPEGEFLLFDPAFAGTEIPPLLAFIKTTFHDTLAHPWWLYEPSELSLELTYTLTDERIEVTHNQTLTDVAPARWGVLEQKFREVWQPLVAHLRAEGMLPSDWREVIRKGLFCCPFLVKNLIGGEYSPAVQLLGLGRAVELGARGSVPDAIDRLIENL